MKNLTDTFNVFCSNKTWEEKVISGDSLWQQVKTLLAENGQVLQATPRRPDVRLICQNLTGSELRFKNPGDHSGSEKETIPASGDSTSVMIMLCGLTLNEQYKNAQTLFQTYNLGTKGFSAELLADMNAGKLSALIDEAYGRAPFEEQASKLKPLLWENFDGTTSNIQPVVGTGAAFGARPATEEQVFLAEFPLHVKGTSTIAELVESEGMAIAISADSKTGVEETRPIVPSVARTYYGLCYGQIPVVTVDVDGSVINVKVPKKPSAPLQKTLVK